MNDRTLKLYKLRHRLILDIDQTLLEHSFDECFCIGEVKRLIKQFDNEFKKLRGQ